MRWVLIRPFYNSQYYDPEIQEPLGLEYLASVIRTEGDKVLLLDSCLDNLSNTKLARRAASFQPDIIGFSMTTGQQLDSALEIYSECNRTLKSGKHLWITGGNFISTESDQALRLLPSEICLVRLEGENSLRKIRSMFESLNGKNDNGGLQERLVISEPVEVLDSLPFPHRDFADRVIAAGWAFNIQGSRGCCGSCLYCASPKVWGKHRRWRGRSVSNIVEELSQLNKNYGAVSFNFIDEDFLGPRKGAFNRASEFHNLIINSNLKIAFGIQVRPDSLDEKIIELLTEAGLNYVFMGLESDNAEDFKRWQRKWTPNPWRFVTLLREKGVGIGAGILLFHSHSTLSGIRRFAGKLHEYRLLEFRSATNRLDAMPGSEFYKWEKESGCFKPDMLGPQPISFLNSNVANLYDDLILALEPLGPPSMHAVCALPPLLAQCRHDSKYFPRYSLLNTIINRLDDEVAAVLFTLLDYHEKNIADKNIVQSLRQHSLNTAISATQQLFEDGFAQSFDQLREAIRIDSGL